jgi:hypothetical protein
MGPKALSPSALALFKRHVELGRTTDLEANRAVYEELVRAGLMIVGNSFAGARRAFITSRRRVLSERLNFFLAQKKRADRIVLRGGEDDNLTG